MVGTLCGGGGGSAGHDESSGDESFLQKALSMMEALMSKFDGMQKNFEEVRRDQSGLRSELSAGKPVEEGAAGSGDRPAKNAASAPTRPRLNSVPDRTRLLSIGEANKTYFRELSDDHVSKIGDAKFLAAKMNQIRLCSIFRLKRECRGY